MIITRSACRLRPPARDPVLVTRHPGIVVHCTGGVRPESERQAFERWRVCQAGHMGGNGWADIGYHFAVTPTGSVLEGRGWGVRGAHAAGYNRWLGVVVLGKGLDITEDEQVALQSLYAEHLARGGGPKVIPHNAVSRKACPGPAVTEWLLDRWPPAVLT